MVGPVWSTCARPGLVLLQASRHSSRTPLLVVKEKCYTLIEIPSASITCKIRLTACSLLLEYNRMGMHVKMNI